MVDPPQPAPVEGQEREPGVSTPSSGTKSSKLAITQMHRTPSLRTALIVFVTVLILFRWLHLLLALQITSAGRQIEASTQALRRYERGLTALQAAIADAESPATLGEAARRLGYRPRALIYLPVDGPFPAPDDGGLGSYRDGVDWAFSPAHAPFVDTDLP